MHDEPKKTDNLTTQESGANLCETLTRVCLLLLLCLSLSVWRELYLSLVYVNVLWSVWTQLGLLRVWSGSRNSEKLNEGSITCGNGRGELF